MIKKNLKTLDDLQNPKKRRIRFQFDDGTFIDADEDDAARYRALQTLFNQLDENNTITIGDTTDNVAPPSTENEPKTFKEMFKKDVLFWDKALFIFLSAITLLTGWFSYLIKYSVGGPIKTGPTTEIPFLEGGLYWVGVMIGFVTIVSQITRVINFTLYITAFIKFLLFIILTLSLLLTLGMINRNVCDNVCSFFGKCFFFKKEHDIIKMALE